MSNADVARRFFEEFCNGRRLDLATELLTEDHRYHDPNVPTADGPAGMAATIAFYQTNVEGHWEVHDVVAAGDRVAVRWAGSGTHVGELNGIAPTGRHIEVEAISVLRLENGRIAENWTVWDTLGMLRQIGALPEPVGAQSA